MKRQNKAFLLALGLTLLLPAFSMRAAPGHFGGFGHRGRVFIGVGGGWGWGWGWPGWYGYYGHSPYAYGQASQWAVVDTDVSPEEARVYLDGRYIGTADDFDGWPDYLYLGPGRYRLEFRLEGYEPRILDINARPGTYRDITDKLRKVPGAPQHGSYETPKLEGGLKRYFAKRQGRNVEFDPSQPRGGYGYDRDNEGNEGNPSPAEGDRPPAVARPRRDQRGESWRGSSPSARGDVKSRLRLTVEPSDAAVYVDNKFIGTGEEVNSLERGIAVSSGKHTVTVSRPGFRDKTSEIAIEEGKTETLDISLGH